MTVPGRERTGRRKGRTTATGLTVALALGLGVLVTTTGVAGAHGIGLFRAPGATAGHPALVSTADSSPLSSATAGTTPHTSAPAPAAPAVPTPKSAGTTPGAAAVSAPPVTAPGRSVVLSAGQQPSQVGAVFTGSLAAGHSCTASVVDSPAGDLIVTAAHCLSSGTAKGSTFVPGYRDGTAPFGVWQITDVLEDAAWTGGHDPDHDVAFAVVQPLDGRSLQSVVGSYGLDTSGVSSATVQITGYPSSTDEPISCTGSSSAFGAAQLRVYCTGYPSGTSGSGWVENYDRSTGTGAIMGVIGGYQTGGDTADVSYSTRFGSSTQALYRQAEAAGA